MNFNLFSVLKNISFLTLFLGVYYEMEWLVNTAFIFLALDIVSNFIQLYFVDEIVGSVGKNSIAPKYLMYQYYYLLLDGFIFFLLASTGHLILALFLLAFSILNFIVFRNKMHQRSCYDAPFRKIDIQKSKVKLQFQYYYEKIRRKNEV